MRLRAANRLYIRKARAIWRGFAPPIGASRKAERAKTHYYSKRHRRTDRNFKNFHLFDFLSNNIIRNQIPRIRGIWKGASNG